MDEYTKIIEGMRTRIFSLMKELNISQKELAEKIQVSPQTITDWKKGKSNSFSTKLSVLAPALQTTPAWLYWGKGTKYLPDEEREIILQQEKIYMDYLASEQKKQYQEMKQELQDVVRKWMKNNNFTADDFAPGLVESFAQALGVSTSELLGEARTKNLAIQDQPYLVMRYNSLPPKVQEEVMAFIEFKVAQQSEKK